MKKIPTVLLLIITVLSNAQTISAPLDLSLNIELVNKVRISDAIWDTLTNPMNMLSPSDTIRVSAMFSTPDTINLSKIHVKLGSTDGGSELLSHSFDFDNLKPGNGFSYLRKKNDLKISLGKYAYMSNFFLEIFFEDYEGVMSNAVKYQSN